jgi:hypothetical protein
MPISFCNVAGSATTAKIRNRPKQIFTLQLWWAWFDDVIDLRCDDFAAGKSQLADVEVARPDVSS